MLDEGEAFAVERQACRHRSSIVDRHPMRFGDAVRARYAGRRVISQVHRLFSHRREVVEDTLDARKALDRVTREAHRSLLKGLEADASSFPNTTSLNSSNGAAVLSTLARSTAPSQALIRNAARTPAAQ